jgi:DNA-binding transcriptional regulator YiaG
MDAPADPAAQPLAAGDQLPAGSVAGAVLQAARRSASLSPRELADALHLAERSVHAWENGTEPLASIPVH